MCGRFALTEVEMLEPRFNRELEAQFSVSPRFNVAPGQYAPIITRDAIVPMKWGLVPSWAKDAKIGYKMINARAETVIEKPMYRGPFKKSRVLVPATGFYEWLVTPEGKQPYYFKLKSGGLFSFAGLSDTWYDAEKFAHKTFTIITTTPNSLVGKVHDRMPVILNKEDEELWLDPETPPEIAEQLLDAYPGDEMEAYPVSKDVNKVANDGPELILNSR